MREIGKRSSLKAGCVFEHAAAVGTARVVIEPRAGAPAHAEIVGADHVEDVRAIEVAGHLGVADRLLPRGLEAGRFARSNDAKFVPRVVGDSVYEIQPVSFFVSARRTSISTPKRGRARVVDAVGAVAVVARADRSSARLAKSVAQIAVLGTPACGDRPRERHLDPLAGLDLVWSRGEPADLQPGHGHEELASGA